MIYFVSWQPQAERQLTEIWIDADDREAITAAAAEIDRLLTSSAATVGESREENRRILFVSPLAAIVRVVEEDRVASVVAVWKPTRRR